MTPSKLPPIGEIEEELMPCSCGREARVYHTPSPTILIGCSEGVTRQRGHPVLTSWDGDDIARAISFWNRTAHKKER
jgi:hypothetical protein